MNRKRISPEDHLAQYLTNLFPWVEETKVETIQPCSVTVTVKHTYPDGVNVAPFIKRIVNAQLTAGIVAEFCIERIQAT